MQTSTLKLPLLSTTAANTIHEKLNLVGLPTIDRVVLAVPNMEFKTNSGIIIPGGQKEDVPRKGTIVQVGMISEDYQYFKELLNIGSVITYGNYAGKKIEPDGVSIDGYDLMVLSLTEICYIENVKND